MATAEQFLDVVRSFVGVVEIPPGSNRTAIGRAFGWDGVAWCAETVSVAAGRVGMPWLHTAAVGQVRAWAQQGFHGMRWLPPGAQVQPGDLILFDWHGRGRWADMHIGTVEKVLGPGRWQTIEGNLQDRCQRTVRTTSSVMGFARLPFTTTVWDSTKEWDEMATKEEIAEVVRAELAAYAAKHDPVDKARYDTLLSYCTWLQSRVADSIVVSAFWRILGRGPDAKGRAVNTDAVVASRVTPAALDANLARSNEAGDLALSNRRTEDARA